MAAILSLTPKVAIVLVTVIWTPIGDPVINHTPQPTLDACNKLADEFKTEMWEDNESTGPAFSQLFNAQCVVLPSDDPVPTVPEKGDGHI